MPIAADIFRESRRSSIPSRFFHLTFDTHTRAAANAGSGERTKPECMVQGADFSPGASLRNSRRPCQASATKRLQVLLHNRPHAPSGSGRRSVAAMYNLPVMPLGRSEWRQPSPSVT